MGRLILNVDGYGGDGQLSLLADFVEWCVFVRARAIGHKQIADYLEERRLRVGGFSRVPLVDEAEDVEAEAPMLDRSHLAREARRRQRAQEDAARIGQLLAERERRLNRSYPFRVVRSESSFRVERRGSRITPYHVALAIALSHACARDDDSANDFEAFAADCLRARGYRTFSFAEQRRAERGRGIEAFRAVHTRLVQALGLRAGANAELSPHVNDAGGDVLARVEPVDDRPGCRTILVQATVGKADTWPGKMREVPTSTWAALLGDPIPPLVTLAIPHHIEDAHLHDLVCNGLGATVIDRLRLIAHGPAVSSRQRALVGRLRDQGVEW